MDIPWSGNLKESALKLFTEPASKIDDTGLADGDIDGFLKKLLESVNREAAQNSNDEARTRPVRMTLDMREVPVSEIPDIDSYKYAIERCHQEAVSTGATKAEEFFSNASTVLSGEKVKVLSISDSGTKGAGGEFVKTGKFFTLVISKGRTNKDHVYSAGSFGIGKNAALAGSQFRLVFYSSVFEEDNEKRFYCMGKSVLTSWKDEDENNMNHRIFFGEEGSELLPVKSQDGLPDWLRKEDLGLKVNIIAPRLELKDGWASGFIASFMSNFFLAIINGDLEFSLDEDQVLINKSTMSTYFADKEVCGAAEKAGQADRLQLAKMCVEGLAAEEFVSEIVEIDHLGKFEMMIRVDEGLPKTVCFIRNGMFITNTLENFGRPLLRFQNTKEFIVIVRPVSLENRSSEMIKKMENPEHNELTIGYIANEDEARRLQKSMVVLERRIRDFIKKHAKMEVLSSRSIEEMREYFQKPGDSAAANTKSDEDDPTKVKTHGGKRKPGGVMLTPGGSIGGKGKKRSSRKKTKKKQKGAGSGGGGGYSQVPVECRALRSTPQNWKVVLTDIPNGGEVSIWPEERSRGKETRSVKILSCNATGANISSDALSVKFPVGAGSEIVFDIQIESASSVIDLHPMLSYQGKQ